MPLQQPHGQYAEEDLHETDETSNGERVLAGSIGQVVKLFPWLIFLEHYGTPLIYTFTFPARR